MKRIFLFSLAAVLLTIGPVRAELKVYEYVPGEKVTLDTLTGNYWYYNLLDFAGKTYDQQKEKIATLGTYGNIAGGWHMATPDEWTELWNEYESFSIHTSSGWFWPGYWTRRKFSVSWLRICYAASEGSTSI